MAETIYNGMLWFAVIGAFVCAILAFRNAARDRDTIYELKKKLGER